MTAIIAVGLGIALFAPATGGSCSAYHVASPRPDPTFARLAPLAIASVLLHQPLPLLRLQINLNNEVLEHPTPKSMLSDKDRPLPDAFGPVVAQRMSLLADTMWLHIGMWVATFDRSIQTWCAKD